MIRKANKNDISQIMNLLNEVLYVHYLIHPDIFKERGSKYTKSELEKIIDNELTPVFVYVDENNNVLAHAFVKFIYYKETNNTNMMNVLFIDDLCVKKGEQSKGIGSKMYQFLKEFATKNDFDKIQLHVWEGNEKAKKFYNKCGLKIQSYTLEDKIK